MNSYFDEISVTSSEADSIYEIINKSLPDECIIRIFKVNNPYLVDRYESIKTSMLVDCNPKEETVFHGCSLNSVNNIVKKGFLSEYNKTSAYGKGTYVATSYDISRQYSLAKSQTSDKQPYQFLLICKALIGRVGMMSGPYEIDRSKYDCIADNIRQPRQYTIADDYAVLPLYAIEFYSGR